MRSIIDILKHWQNELKINDWNISLERISPEQIKYDGEDYFVGVSRNFDKKEATIHHDIDLDEESIVHELLHIRYPEKNETWINAMTSIVRALQYLGDNYNLKQ